MESSEGSDKNFFKHVFNFDDDSKCEMLNIIQYSLLAIIPIVVLNKIMFNYVPEANDKKGSLEISAEIVIQVMVIFIGFLFIHRIITFVPTYSGLKYPDVSVIFVVLTILMITMSLQTKLGEKVNILVERVVALWEGKTSNKKNTKKSGQPTQNVSQSPNQTAMNQSLYSDGTSINSLPTNDMSAPNTNQMMPQQLPDYNNMYRQDNTPLPGAATPGMNVEGFSTEPMAANSVLGGGSFGSW
jgi:hypothetical protein